MSCLISTVYSGFGDVHRHLISKNQNLDALEGVHNHLQGKWLVSQPLRDLHPRTERPCVWMVLEWMAMVDRDAILILLLQSKL